MTSTVFFAIYLIIMLGVGISSIIKSKRNDEVDFQLASREHGAIVTALSASASSESGFVLLGLVGFAYSIGINTLWILPAGLIGYLINWYIVGDRLRDFSASNNLITVSEVLSFKAVRYKKTITLLSSLIIIVLMTLYVAAQFNATGKALESIFEINYKTGVLFGCIFVLIYALIGGFRAVSWTDVLQAGMMAISLFILPLMVIVQLGGFSHLWTILRDIDPTLTSLTAGKQGMEALGSIVGWVALGIAYMGQPHVLVRFMAAKDRDVFKKAPIIAISWFQLIYAGAILLGLSARAAFNNLPTVIKDPENILPIMTMELLPPVLSGLALAAIIAAIASTADSQLLVVASSFSNDIKNTVKKTLATKYKNRIMNRISGLLSKAIATTDRYLNRIMILFVGVLAMVIALLEKREIFSFILDTWSLLGASLGPVVLFTLYKKKIFGIEIISGMLSGIIFTVLLTGSDYKLILSFTLSFIFILATHFVVNIRNENG